MPIGKSSINRVAAGLENPEAAPMNPEETPAAVTVEIEKKIVESTATAPTAEKSEETVATKVEKKIVKSTAKKPAAKKPAEKKAAAAKKETKKPAKKAAAVKIEAAEEKKAPELVGQAVAAPAPKKRGRKPGSKNKPKVAVAETVKAPAEKAAPKKRVKDGFGTVAIGQELPVHLL